MSTEIQIVDRGRGPQLSTSRITVQDLVPYVKQNYSHEQMREIMPVLTVEDIQAVEQYVRENYAAVMEQDRRIEERNANRTRSPEVEEILRRGGDKMAALREEFGKRRKRLESNGDSTGC